MKTFSVFQNDAGQRLDKFLQKAAPLLPVSLLYKSIRQKNIKLNGKRCVPGVKLTAGDVVSLYLPDEFFAPRPLPFLGAPPDINVVYEDEHILLVNKPQGLLVHEGDGQGSDTLIWRILHYLYKKGDFDPQTEQSFTPALCNRIDRNTGGIVIAAKSFEALQILSEKIKARQVTKLYMCIIYGIMAHKSGTLKGYHQKDAESNTVRITREPAAGSKTALTRYRILAERGGKSLVEAELLTGRTHQIRAQFAAAGYPILGDSKYGSDRRNALLKNRQALLAYKVIFSFTTPAGALDYLAGKSFEIDVPFAGEFDGFFCNIPIL